MPKGTPKEPGCLEARGRHRSTDRMPRIKYVRICNLCLTMGPRAPSPHGAERQAAAAGWVQRSDPAERGESFGMVCPACACLGSDELHRIYQAILSAAVVCAHRRWEPGCECMILADLRVSWPGGSVCVCSKHRSYGQHRAALDGCPAPSVEPITQVEGVRRRWPSLLGMFQVDLRRGYIMPRTRLLLTEGTK